jgi:hypothetical protein
MMHADMVAPVTMRLYKSSLRAIDRIDSKYLKSAESRFFGALFPTSVMTRVSRLPAPWSVVAEP